MAKQIVITPDICRQLLDYDPETGCLRWKTRTKDLFLHARFPERACASFNAKIAGLEAFTCPMPTGHLQGRIWGNAFLAHRVIMAIVYGKWPKECVDHINGDPTDNRLSNLRLVSKKENHRNSKMPSTNTSGHIGVRPKGKKFLAEIKVDGRNIRIGSFDSFDEACEARLRAQDQHGFHKNHGRAT